MSHRSTSVQRKGVDGRLLSRRENVPRLLRNKDRKAGEVGLPSRYDVVQRIGTGGVNPPEVFDDVPRKRAGVPLDVLSERALDKLVRRFLRNVRVDKEYRRVSEPRNDKERAGVPLNDLSEIALEHSVRRFLRDIRVDRGFPREANFRDDKKRAGVLLADLDDIAFNKAVRQFLRDMGSPHVSEDGVDSYSPSKLQSYFRIVDGDLDGNDMFSALSTVLLQEGDGIRPATYLHVMLRKLICTFYADPERFMLRLRKSEHLKLQDALENTDFRATAELCKHGTRASLGDVNILAILINRNIILFNGMSHRYTVFRGAKELKVSNTVYLLVKDMRFSALLPKRPELVPTVYMREFLPESAPISDSIREVMANAERVVKSVRHPLSGMSGEAHITAMAIEAAKRNCVEARAKLALAKVNLREARKNKKDAVAAVSVAESSVPVNQLRRDEPKTIWASSFPGAARRPNSARPAGGPAAVQVPEPAGSIPLPEGVTPAVVIPSPSPPDDALGTAPAVRTGSTRWGLLRERLRAAMQPVVPEIQPPSPSAGVEVATPAVVISSPPPSDDALATAPAVRTGSTGWGFLRERLRDAMQFVVPEIEPPLPSAGVAVASGSGALGSVGYGSVPKMDVPTPEDDAPTIPLSVHTSSEMLGLRNEEPLGGMTVSRRDATTSEPPSPNVRVVSAPAAGVVESGTALSRLGNDESDAEESIRLEGNEFLREIPGAVLSKTMSTKEEVVVARFNNFFKEIDPEQKFTVNLRAFYNISNELVYDGGELCKATESKFVREFGEGLYTLLKQSVNIFEALVSLRKMSRVSFAMTGDYLLYDMNKRRLVVTEQMFFCLDPDVSNITSVLSEDLSRVLPPEYAVKLALNSVDSREEVVSLLRKFKEVKGSSLARDAIVDDIVDELSLLRLTVTAKPLVPGAIDVYMLGMYILRVLLAFTLDEMYLNVPCSDYCEHVLSLCSLMVKFDPEKRLNPGQALIFFNAILKSCPPNRCDPFAQVCVINMLA